MEKNDKTLVVYFSYTIGNTKRIAEKIGKSLGADVEALEPAVPYSRDYNKVVSQGEQEVQRGFLPKLKPLKADLSAYSRIIVGSPTWWYEPAPAVMSFLKGNDLTGKTVIPFMTDAGWPGHVLESMTRAAQGSGAKVEKGREFRFSPANGHRDEMKTAAVELNDWIESLK